MSIANWYKIVTQIGDRFAAKFSTVLVSLWSGGESEVDGRWSSLYQTTDNIADCRLRVMWVYLSNNYFWCVQVTKIHVKLYL